MVNVQTEILIRRRRDDVADYAANPDNAPGAVRILAAGGAVHGTND